MKKIGIFAIGFLVVIGIYGNLSKGKNNPAPSTEPEIQSNQAATTDTPTQALKPTIEPTTTPETPAVSEQDQIKILVTDQLKGQNGMKKDKLKSVEVSEQKNGGWGVAVEFNASDNLTKNLQRSGIERQMSEVYTALYKSGKNIKTASVNAYFPLRDQYGNVSDYVIYATTLDGDEASKVNWNVDQSVLNLSILPGIWTTNMLHPELVK